MWRNRTALLASLLLTALSCAAKALQFGDFEYVIEGGEVTITQYVGEGGEVVVPSFVEGLPVTQIGPQAFFRQEIMISVSFPDSVTSVGRSAFEGCLALQAASVGNGIGAIPDRMFYECSSLRDFTIPPGVESIGEGAFNRCRSLTQLVIPDGVITVGSAAFGECDKLDYVRFPAQIETIPSHCFVFCKNLVRVDLPDSLQRIETAAFYRCYSLKDIELPDSLVEIGDWAFESCESLTSVSISESVAGIGTRTFGYCSQLERIEVDPANTVFRSVDGVMFNIDQTVLLQYPGGKPGSFVIPDTVVTVETSAFSGSTRLEEVAVPSGVSELGGFYQCASLNAIQVDASNASYTSFQGVLFNKDVSELLAFPGAKHGAFVVPESVHTIKGGAFASCKMLEQVAIPGSVRTIEDYAFRDCAKLTAIEVSDDNRNYSSIDGVLFSKDLEELIQCPGGHEGTYIVPEFVQVVRQGAFWGSRSLEKVVLGMGIGRIPSYAFAYCDNLESVTIPENVTIVNHRAFFYCDALKTIVIPSSVTGVGDNSFEGCENLVGVYFEGNPPSKARMLRLTRPEELTVFYLPDSDGWGDSYEGHPTALWLPSPRTNDDSFGVVDGAFGFNVGWAGDREVVVEAAQDVADPLWEELARVTLTDGEAHFSDHDWAEHPGRFYRVRGL